MKRSSLFSGVLALCACLGFAWAATTPEPNLAPRPNVQVDRVATQDLGGMQRFIAHLNTDKQIYKPGESVYARSVILHALTNAPVPDQWNSQWQSQGFIEVKGPRGNVVLNAQANTQDSVTAFRWQVPEDQDGGEYTIKVSYTNLGIPAVTRKVDIRAYRAPRMKTQIKFVRDGYGPGDSVGATVEVHRAEGSVPEGARVVVTARVDGRQVHRSNTKVGRDGFANANFKLPDAMNRGDGTIVFTIQDGGVVETATKTIPILLQTVDLTMYPEGGDLIAGIPNRLYIEGRTPAKKPADIAGFIVDQDGKHVAPFKTEHEGRGRVTFIPRANTNYALKITEPAGITKTFALPTSKNQGVVIQSKSDVFAADKAIELEISSVPYREDLTLTVSKKEDEVGRAGVSFNNAKTLPMVPVSIDLKDDASGVLIVTAWDGNGKPLAERLIYRQPRSVINVKVEPDADQYVPGAFAGIRVTTTDVDGKPVAAVVGLNVTDDSVLEMVDKREQRGQLPVMVFLESAVKELADAHVYLDNSDDQAPLATDLLLGTQGWRRFAFVDPVKFVSEHGDDARRVLAMRAVTQFELQKRREVMILNRGRFRGDVPKRAAVQFDAAAIAPLAPQAAAPVPVPVVAAAAEQPPVDLAFDAPVEVAAAEIDLGQAAPAPVGKAAQAPQPVVDAKQQAPQVKLDDARKRQAEHRRRVQAAQPAAPPAPNSQLRALADALNKRLEADDADELIALELEEVEQPVQFITVRQYAHRIDSPNTHQPGQRNDFTETLFWHAGIKTDASTGQATIKFGLSDSVTSFRVFADAFHKTGALGAATTTIESVEPFYVEPKLPLEVTMGDEVQVPINIVNATKGTLPRTTVSINTAKGIRHTGLSSIDLRGDTRVRQLSTLSIGDVAGPSQFTLTASAGDFSDRVTRTLNVVPRGFPVEIGQGGLLQPNDKLAFKINIPETRVPGSVTTKLEVFPTPMGNLTSALERLIREPYGCFEQTSSTTFPLIMAQQYFQSHRDVDPELITRSRKSLDKGYNRLIGFECKSGGFEWFGADPGHEALTAYGLLEFTEMSKVRPVDQDMLSHTRSWLLGTRDGNGAFSRKRRALHTWITDPGCSNGYITWSLLKCGESPDSLQSEVDTVIGSGCNTKNSYVVALSANVAALAGDQAAARKLMDRLVSLQESDGRVSGGTTSIVGSGGQALVIETTALATLAWLKNDKYIDATRKAIKWLNESCKAGRYGSTQSTVLALAAIVTYDEKYAAPKAAGSIELRVNGYRSGDIVKFTKSTKGAIKLTDIAELLEPGEHVIEIHMNGGSSMPVSAAVEYHNEQPDTSPECQVRVKASLRNSKLLEGTATEVDVTVTNQSDKPVPTPMAIIGIPGGLEVRHDQLKELVKAERIAAYEVRGREVILYWRSFEANQKVYIPISVVAEIPGKYVGPASRAYLYYTDEHKDWIAPLTATVRPRIK